MFFWSYARLAFVVYYRGIPAYQYRWLKYLYLTLAPKRAAPRGPV